jgi:hypothetical protein
MTSGRCFAKSFCPPQDFVLTALHVDLHQLWRRYAGANKVIEPDRRYVYYFTAPQYGAFSISLHAALRLRGCTTTKPDSIDRGARPYSGVYHAQATLQPIPRTVFLQTHDVFGVTVESYNKTQVTNKQSCPKRHSAHVSADVIDNVTLANHSLNRILHFGFMLPSPDERLSGKMEMHPHSRG